MPNKLATSSFFFPFILAGGSGERFWPASRTKKPKHLLQLLDKKTLLEQTVERFESIAPQDQLFILTNQAQQDLTQAILPNFAAEQILIEPCKRDTAPAAALATAVAMRKNREAIVGLFAADAMIHDTKSFQQQIHEAIVAACSTTALLTFAITPTYPATGFGYLELGEKLENSFHPKNLFRQAETKEKKSSSSTPATSFYRVKGFVEKPSLEKAERFLTQGCYHWNAGMFLWRGSSFLAECQRQAPELANFIEEMMVTEKPEELLTEKFPHLPKISVDYAIMEGAREVMAAQAQFDWDDVGSWRSLPCHLGVNDQGNTIPKHSQNVITLDAKNNIILSEEKTIALCGVENLVVVETQDAILVCHRDAVEKIKQLPLPQELR